MFQVYCMCMHAMYIKIIATLNRFPLAKQTLACRRADNFIIQLSQIHV